MLGHAAAVIERIGNMVRAGLGGGRPAPCRTAADLAALMAGEAAFVGQKTVVEFCRLRAGCNWSRLAGAEEFRAIVEASRWRSFLILLGDVAEIVQIFLRGRGAEGAATPERLGPVARRALLFHGTPPIPGDWPAEGDELERRLARSLLAAPRPVHVLGERSGVLVFDALPFRTDLGRLDREYVVNAVRFALCGVHERLERRAELPTLARALLAEPTTGGGTTPTGAVRVRP